MYSDALTRLSLSLAGFFGEHLMPAMFALLFGGVALRLLAYYTIKAEERFSREFEKRVHRHLDREYPELAGLGFHETTEKLLNRTYDEIFNLRAKNMRRKLDRISSVSDRLFLVEEGAKRLIEDTLKQTRYYEKGNVQPQFPNVSKFVFMSNPVFNRVVGAFPMRTVDDLLNILPGIFIIGGLFGTFLGIMAGLPELRSMDVSNMDAAKTTLDQFLVKMAYAMNTSIFGIICSVAITVLNTVFSPAGLFVGLVEKYTLSLEFLWNDTMAGADPRSIDLDKHPEIRSRLPRPREARARVTLPKGMPLADELVTKAREAEHAPPSGRDWTSPDERIDVDAFRASRENEAGASISHISQQKTALLEDSAGGRASVGGFDPANHEPPAYGEDDATGRIVRPGAASGDEGRGAPVPSEDESFDPAAHEPPAYSADEAAAANEDYRTPTGAGISSPAANEDIAASGDGDEGEDKDSKAA